MSRTQRPALAVSPRLRVVAGEFRGRRISSPPLEIARPTKDRVKEALFSALGARGLVDGALVMDLFAGSGALGIEALSRGAEHCIFVDSNRGSVSVIERNLALLHAQDRATVVFSDVLGFLRSSRSPDRSVDLAFADPPYDSDYYHDLLALVPASYLATESRNVVKVNRVIGEPLDEGRGPLVSGERCWEVAFERRYGESLVSVFEQIDCEPDRREENECLRH